MVTFGLITEGITDQIILENILYGYFNSDNIVLNELQPLRDETDQNRTENSGGWKLAFDYCESEKFKEAVPYNDYIIIQIDTDVSEEVHYDISKRDEEGNELSAEQLIQKVENKFKNLIGNDFYEQHQEKIIFAIGVHSSECWLLPLYYSDNKRAKLINCLGTLNRELQRKEGFTIDPDNKNVEFYRTISKQYSKHRTLMPLYTENPSLKIFIENLQQKNIVVEEEDDDF